jgi:hypothetical protein
MAGVWTPTETLLGTHVELESFSHSITYIEPAGEADPLADPPVEGTEEIRYTVRIVALEGNPTTVTFTTGDPGIVAGFFKRVFNDLLRVFSFSKIINLRSGLRFSN